MASTRRLSLGYPGYRNAETLKPIHAKPFRGFSYQDFKTSKYKETDPWDSQVPKHRNTKLKSRYTISGFLLSDFATGEYKETGPWDSRVPKHRNTKL
jgi:hypothetical protein